MFAKTYSHPLNNVSNTSFGVNQSPTFPFYNSYMRNVKFTFYSLPVFQISLFVLEATLERITIDYYQNHRKLPLHWDYREFITFHLREEQLEKNLKFELDIAIDTLVDIENMYDIVVDIENTERKMDIEYKLDEEDIFVSESEEGDAVEGILDPESVHKVEDKVELGLEDVLDPDNEILSL
ncbi:hypothetical protein H8356DRAFT_1429916 [Neocallimastix lanati (nom. inval.)]|nr:hypothetical protein H8356DRAFT_1429916 [Neocallimastix sp. JGI-2020a]